MELRRTIHSPTTMPTTWPSTVGQGSASHLHPGEGADAEDEQGIQDEVDYRADALDDHRAHSVAGCLKGALSGKLHADADGGPGDDGEVLDAVVDHLGLPGGEELHKDRSQAHPQDQKDHPADQIDEVAVGHYPVGLVGPVLPQPAGQQGVEAHAGAYAHGRSSGSGSGRQAPGLQTRRS